MTNLSNPPVTASAAAHAERIRQAGQQRAAVTPAAGGQQTYERYAARILPGYQADEAARERARLNELQARGVISAEADEPDIDEDEADQEEVPEDEADIPLTAAEIYAARALGRSSAEGRAAAVAWKGTTTGGALIV
jgi:hypothetical protein